MKVSVGCICLIVVAVSFWLNGCGGTVPTAEEPLLTTAEASSRRCPEFVVVGPDDDPRTVWDDPDPCFVPAQKPYDGPKSALLRINLNDGNNFTRADKKELTTDGLVVVELVNNGDEILEIPAYRFSCFRTDLYLIGINDDDEYYGPSTIGPGTLVLRPGDVKRIEFDFRKMGYKVKYGTGAAKLWGLKNGCYDSKLKITSFEIPELVRLCYTGEEAAEEVAKGLDMHLKCLSRLGQPFSEPDSEEQHLPEWPFDVVKDQIASTDVRDEHGNTPLIWAAGVGDFNLVQELLSRKADTKARGGGNNTALTAAVFEGHGNIVDALLEAGADPNTLLDRPTDTLDLALALGQAEVVKALVEHGAEVAPRQLFLAAKTGGASLVKWLVAHGVDPNVRAVGLPEIPNSGLNALEIAVQENSKALIDALVENGADPRQTSGEGWTSLILSSRSCSYYSVDHLLELLGKVEQEEVDAALAAAAMNGCYLVAEFLLERGADPGSRIGRSGLVVAAQKGKFNMVRLLAERGADVNASSLTFRSLLYRLRVVNKLLEEGEKSKAEKARIAYEEIWPTYEARVPLAIALYYSHEKTAAVMLEFGVNLPIPAEHRVVLSPPEHSGNSMKENQFTPTDEEVDKANAAIIKYLVERLQSDIIGNNLEFLMKNFEHYWVQYYGMIEGGKRTVVCNFFNVHPDSPPDKHEYNMSVWRKEPVKVLGGGAGYWKALYSCDTDTVLLVVNAGK